MQPHTSQPGNGRGRNVLGDSPVAEFAAKLILPILAAVMLTATLLLALPATAGAAPSAPQRQGSTSAQASVQAADDDCDDDGCEDDDDDDGASGPGQEKRNEVVGIVVGVPITSPDGFVGDWQIAVNATRTVTVTITADTKIDKKFTEPPARNAAVQVRGKYQADGSFLAKRLRPNKFVSGEVVVRLNASEEITSVLNRYDLVLVQELLSSARIYRLAGSDSIEEDKILAAMKDDRAIMWAEFNYVSGVPADTEGNPYRTWKWGSSDPSGYENQAALQQINLLPAQGRFDGQGVIVAVLDTGVDTGHPALAGRLLPGRDLVNEDDIPQDGPEVGEAAGLAQGHGTHVSGIILRVAPQSKILPVRVLDVNGGGNTYLLAYAIEWAANTADVINLSLGSEFDSHVLSDTIAAAQERGVVIVAAAGNDGVNVPQYPANFPGVLGVTAVDDSNHKADFANYGDGWIDLAAPGVGITSTVPVSETTAEPILYATWSGTSMAVPFVSGAAALVKQQEPDAPAAAVVEKLTAAGADLDAGNPQYAGQLGRLLDIGAALDIAPDAQASPALYLPTVRR
jgi:subtilisin family serine protease